MFRGEKCKSGRNDCSRKVQNFAKIGRIESSGRNRERYCAIDALAHIPGVLFDAIHFHLLQYSRGCSSSADRYDRTKWIDECHIDDGASFQGSCTILRSFGRIAEYCE